MSTTLAPVTVVCRDFMEGRCTREQCKFPHLANVCKRFWRQGSCKFGEKCRHRHDIKPMMDVRKTHATRHSKPKNTENFEPLDRPVDMRVVCDLGTKNDKLSTRLTPRDVLLAPCLFNDFAPGELYKQLEAEITNCGVPQDRLLKLWHGDNHFIADDHTNWKERAPTFAMILERLHQFFNMDIKATRFNWYKDTSQWKPFHHDAAALKPKQAATQNFTVAVSFGAIRDAAFEEVKSKTVISMPQPDGTIYAFAKDTNILWKHGILKETETREEGRISIIAWGHVNYEKNPCIL